MSDTNTAEASTTTEDQVQDNQGVEFEDGSGFTFDMSGVAPDSGFPDLPLGNFPATIEEVEWKKSSKGNWMWNITWTFQYEDKPRKTWTFVIFKADQMGRVKLFLQRVAPELADKTDLDPKKVAEEGLLVGKEGVLKIQKGKDADGNPRNQVRDVLAAGTATASSGEGAGFKL